jgi:hypothetical protein
MMIRIALRAINTAKITGIDGFDSEENRLAPDMFPVKQVTNAGGDPIEVLDILHTATSCPSAGAFSSVERELPARAQAATLEQAR